MPTALRGHVGPYLRKRRDWIESPHAHAKPWAWHQTRRRRRNRGFAACGVALRRKRRKTHFFFVGLSSPSLVHCRPTAFTSFGNATCGTSTPNVLPRPSRIFAVFTLKSLSRSATTFWSTCSSAPSDHISSGSPTGNFVFGPG